MRKLLLGLLCFAAVETEAKVKSVIEIWNTKLYVPSSTNLVITEYMKIQILNEEGYQFAVFNEYYDSFRKIKSLKYTIYDATGKRVKKLGKADAVDVMFNSSYEIGDVRTVVLDPNYKNFPFTVEIEVEIDYNSFFTFPVWMPRFAPDVEVKKATLVVETFDGYVYRSREFNGILPPKLEPGVPGFVKKTWEVANLPAMPKQVNYKSFSEEQPKVHLSPVSFILDKSPGSFQTWKEFGDWFSDLNSGRNSLTDETKSYLTQLRSQNREPHEVIKEIYRHMQAKTRYISIQLGIGGFQTIPSDVVEKTGYGDCKALTNYMKAMLDYISVPSNYVLVRAGEDVPDVIPDFPSNQFNHVFLAVPMKTDTMWLECTSQIVPPSFIGTFTDDRNVLWVQKNASQIIRTPIYLPEETRKYNRCQIVVNEAGDMDIKLSTKQTGAFFDDVMAYKGMMKDDISRFNYGKFDYKDFTITSFNFEVPDPDQPELVLNFNIKAKGVAKPIGSKLVLSSNLLFALEKELITDAMNKKSEIRRGFTLEDDVELTIPELFRVDMLPQAVKDVTEFGAFEMKVFADEKNVIHIYRKTTINKGSYQNETFDKFNNTLKRFKLYEQSKIVLQSKT